MIGSLTPPTTLDRRFEATVESAGLFATLTGSAMAFVPFLRLPTGGIEPTATFARLETMVERAGADDFAREVALVDQSAWTAAHYVWAIRLALRAGAHRPAADMARRSRERYPNDNTVRRLADLLAPLPGPVRRSPADPTLRANRDWFVHHAAQYRGQWVAIKNGELLGAAPTLRELKVLVPDLRSSVISQVE